MKILSGTLLNARVPHMTLACSLDTLICRCISGTFSDAAVLLRFDIRGIIFRDFQTPYPYRMFLHKY